MYTIHEDGTSGGIGGQFENWLWLTWAHNQLPKWHSMS